MKKRFLSLLMAVCMTCSLTMTSCSAAEGPAADETSGLEQLAAETTQATGFSDVPADAWYAEAISWCRENGIMNGTSATTFAPEGTLTRAMLATVLYRMSGSPSVSAPPAFTDTDADSWYSDAVAWAADSGIMAGYGGGTFGVNDPTTREQAVTILWRYAGSPDSAAAGEFSDMEAVSSWAQTAVQWATASGILEGMTNDQQFAPKSPIRRGEVASMLYHYSTGNAVSQPEPTGGKILVAYFSATGTTETIAQRIAAATEADLYEIVPEVPYTDADLNYGNSSSRTTQEQNDPSARPAISGEVEDMADYDIVFLGYPIWHGQAPRIISTFLESYNFSGKTIVPFCTSHSSGIGSSDTNLHSLAPDADWLSGRRFGSGAAASEVRAWVDELQLPSREEQVVGQFNFETQRVLLNSGYEMPIVGLGTYSLSDEECQTSISALLEAGGRLIDTAYMYHNEAAVGQAIRESDVPREEIFVITKLYPSQFGNAAEAIDQALERMGLDYIDMMLLHHPGTGDVEAYHAMEQAVADGKIRSIGLSNWYVEELEEFLPQVTITPALVQNEIHPYYQENDVIPYIQELGIVVQGWYPFGGRGHTGEMLGNATISAIAADHGVTSAQVILRWNLQKGVVVIPGSSNPDHIRENLDVFGFELTQEEMDRINALDRGEKHDWY